MDRMNRMIGELINLIRDLIKINQKEKDKEYPWIKLEFNEVSGWAIHQARKRRKY